MGKQYFAIAIFLLAIIALPVYGYIHDHEKSGQSPEASAGRLSLSDWSFREDGIVTLQGEWEFYRGQLLQPGQFDGSQAGAVPVRTGFPSVPGQWNAYMKEQGRTAGSGYGTYRLLVDFGGRRDGLLGIRVTNIRMAHRIWLNGVEAGSAGMPGTSASDTVSSNAPYERYFPVNASKLEVVVQAANFNYASGGIIYPIWLGDEASIKAVRDRSLIGDIVNVTAFTMFIVFFMFLFYTRRKEPALLYLALFCLSVLVYVLTHGEKLLLAVLPGLSYVLLMKLQALSSTAGYFFLLRYVHVMVPNAIRPAIWRISNLVAAIAFSLAVLLTSLQYSRWFVVPFAMSMFIFGVLLTALVKSFLGRSRDSMFLVMSAACIFIYIVVSTMHVLGVLENQFFISLELLLFVIVQVVMLAKRFSRSFDEVEELSCRLQALNELKDEFMANTSHELRTPLHGIVNIAESLLNGVAGPANPDQKRQLAMVVSTGKRLNYLIDDMLDFSKLRGGELRLNRQIVDLPAAARSVLEVISHLSDKKGVRLTQNWPDNLPPLDTDEDRLRQILFNLLGNAVKFTHQGEISIGAEELDDGMVKVSVRDTGIGIAAERLRDIFLPFNQVAAEDNNGSYAGTGIGLGITKKLIELNGGSIGVESEPGAGSVFWFTLPAASGQAIARGQTAAAAEEMHGEAAAAGKQIAAALPAEGSGLPAGAHTFTVLAVDDDPVNLQVLINLLSIERCSVIAAGSGAEALAELARPHKIDLVITDWMMPGMSGLELCRSIRGRYSLSELPVLMLTARSLAGDIEAAFAAGVNDCLTKPVDGVVLRARVRTMLELRQLVKKAIRSELAFLQAQIKPHFLYNALNTIISVCPTDPDKATELLLELSGYLRSSFDFQSRDQVVMLGKELELVRSYVALEQARFGKRLRMEYELDEELRCPIPPLCIQPIVENAVRHGVMQKTAGGSVKLSVRQAGGGLLVTVSDDGAGMRPELLESLLKEGDSRTGVGFINIHRRLISLYGKGLTIESEAGRGTTVSFEVPQAR
ncbi:response regulator [Paenibacillus sp. N4]|uniref:hybrid sensor histidine kinase/response regulator n=1 Tax=Paenibacillus vietnamensis TaxID=2590547 RepID=UPI001CD0788D|nr:ATP-binding protein [Paenibacillus vietnamensis]MCA0756764.1 response regulator [Paenibacillus vietnamensis]